jgi:hypothetical protein
MNSGWNLDRFLLLRDRHSSGWHLTEDGGTLTRMRIPVDEEGRFHDA